MAIAAEVHISPYGKLTMPNQPDEAGGDENINNYRPVIKSRS
jgi:hypothetical protein